MVARISVGATKDDLRRVAAENPAWRVELDARGTLIVSPPAGGASGARNAELTAKLSRWAAEHGYVAFDSSTGFELPDASIVSPDASLVRVERWRALTREQREEFPPLAPDIAVELVSRSDKPAELRAKLVHMRGQGAEFVVLVDPYRADVWTDGVTPPGFPRDFADVMAAGEA